VVFTAGFDCRRVFGVFFARARFCPATSADTSNIQRTRGFGRSVGILIVCFGTATQEAIYVPRGFLRSLRDAEARLLQDGHSTFNQWTTS
jgi:hypothetical protein